MKQSSRSPRSRVVRALLAGSVRAMLSSCVENRMYRIESIQPDSPLSMAFIEFDDQGELWSQEQLSLTLEHIKAENNAQGGAIVVVFVHGWNHNASPREETRESGNVLGFRRILEQIAQEEHQLPTHRPRPVVGVYIGWHAAATTCVIHQLRSLSQRYSSTRRS